MSDDLPSGGEVLSHWLRENDTSPSMPSAAPENPRPLRDGRWRRALRPSVVLAPWVLALVLLVVPRPDADHTAPRGAGVDTGVGATANPAAMPSAAAAGAATAPVAVTDDEDVMASAEATAVRLVRDAVTGRHGAHVTALDIAAPERARRLAHDVWMVRVHAVVLQGDRRRWRSAAHEIWAVPIGSVGGRSVGLEHPWRVARSDGQIKAGDWQPATIPEKQVHAALLAAGLRPADDMTIERRPGMTGILRASIVTDGAPAHAWLRAGPPLEVLGSTQDGS